MKNFIPLILLLMLLSLGCKKETTNIDGCQASNIAPSQISLAYDQELNGYTLQCGIYVDTLSYVQFYNQGQALGYYRSTGSASAETQVQNGYNYPWPISTSTYLNGTFYIGTFFRYPHIDSATFYLHYSKSFSSPPYKVCSWAYDTITIKP
jgi:hypothetical protein